MFDSDRRLLLDCYPTNPRGYFEIDLRDPTTFERYSGAGLRRLERAARRAPWAIESRYNAARFRGAEIGPKKPGVLRVAALGDSFTEGKGVKERDAYPRILGAILERAEPGRWDVLNCGRRASDFPELYRQFEEVLQLEPDIVLFGMVLNDAEQTDGFRARFSVLSDLIEDRRRGLLRQRYRRLGPWDSRLLALVETRRENAWVRRETIRWYCEMYGEPNREGWEATQSYLRQMAAHMRARGGCLIVALWPLLTDLEGRYPFEDATRTIADACSETGIPFLDLLPAFRGRAAATLWVHPIDMHPNELAHRMAAEALAPFIRGAAAHERP